MALPLGRKALPLIERKAEAVRRLPELAATLEWVLRLSEPPENALTACPPIRHVLTAYAPRLRDAERALAAAAIHHRLVHAVPDMTLPSRAEVEQAAGDLRDEIIHAVQTTVESSPAAAQALEDRLREIAPGAERALDLRHRAALAVWRLDVLSGRRARFTDTRVDPAEVELRLQRYHAALAGHSLPAVAGWIAGDDGFDGTGLVSELQQAVEELSYFDAAWTLEPGVTPLPAIRLEPDLTARIRMLAGMLEHVLAWLPPVKAEVSAAYVERLEREESGAPLRDLVEEREYLFTDVDEVTDALGIAQRLLRVVPGARAVRLEEAEGAEAILWKAVLELRPQCYYEHACAISRWTEALERTVPVSRISEWRSRRARIAALGLRLCRLVDMWHAQDPGLWMPAAAGADMPDPCALLRQAAAWVETAAPDGALAKAFELVRQIDGDPVAGEALADSEAGAAAESALREMAETLERKLDAAQTPRDRRPKPVKEAPAPVMAPQPAAVSAEPQPTGNLLKGLFKSMFGK